MSTFKEIHNKVIEAIDQVEVENEMDQLVSFEFTPTPDYGTIIRNLFEKNGWDLDWYVKELKDRKQYSWWFHSMIS